MKFTVYRECGHNVAGSNSNREFGTFDTIEQAKEKLLEIAFDLLGSYMDDDEIKERFNEDGTSFEHDSRIYSVCDNSDCCVCENCGEKCASSDNGYFAVKNGRGNPKFRELVFCVENAECCEI